MSSYFIFKILNDHWTLLLKINYYYLSLLFNAFKMNLFRSPVINFFWFFQPYFFKPFI